MTSEQRISKYKQLPVTIQEVYSSSEVGEIIRNFASKFQLEETALLNCIGDTILGFNSSSELPKLLQQETGAGADEAQQIISELTEHLSPVLEREAAAGSQQKKELADLQATIGKPAPKTENGATTVPVQTSAEADIHDVTPMRTMERDVQRIHGYGAYRKQNPSAKAPESDATHRSNQDDLLRKAPLVDTPKVDDEK